VDEHPHKGVDKHPSALRGAACRLLVKFCSRWFCLWNCIVSLVHISCGSLPYKRVDNTLRDLCGRVVKWCGENMATTFQKYFSCITAAYRGFPQRLWMTLQQSCG
jgi:hypothetical protein